MLRKDNNLFQNISIYHDQNIQYVDEAPYSPSENYPEYFINDFCSNENKVYNAVRESLKLLGLDNKNFGKLDWNPFRDIIKPGNTVVLKPNFVVSEHTQGGDLYSIITHPSIIRAVVDYVFIALKGKGKIIIADSPQMDCNFNDLLKKIKIGEISKLFKEKFDFNIEILDLREFWLKKDLMSAETHLGKRIKLPGDPLGSILVDLGKESLFYGTKNYDKFYGADYNRTETIKHHHDNVHEYLISKTILAADTIIFLPKLKTHKKVGITLNIKGLVGTVVNKNYLIHYKLGTPASGGDQFPDILNNKEKIRIKVQRWFFDLLLSRKTRFADLIYRILKKLGKPLFKLFGLKISREKSILDGGNWYGNDSAWRMADDLLKIFLYSDREGNIKKEKTRNIFSIVDGVVAGEGEGPLIPFRKRCGLVIAGFNIGNVDLLCSRLMGFDYNKIKMLKYILNKPGLFNIKVRGIKIFSNKDFKGLLKLKNKRKYFNFKPPSGWKGYIEI